jgi:very-short-patch-repair endonuclease
MRDLLRLETVRTKRRDRISSDEEERLRLGFEIRTGVRFALDDKHQPLKYLAAISDNDGVLGQLEYGQAATLWRINLGWARRKDKARRGFVLDMERGFWERNESENTEDEDDPLSPRTARVIPFVRDESNVLLIELDEHMEKETILSLRTALKQGIEAVYQLEDNELSAEVLPDMDTPRLLLFYESAEGGAGVLRRLLEDPNALPQVAAEALRICHYDPMLSIEDGDLGQADGATEQCEAACYDCLLSYSNQYIHQLLDRHRAAHWLYILRDATVTASSSSSSRGEHLQRLLNLCDSQLEKHWLAALEARQLRLPDDAQVYFEACNTRIDFVYRELNAAIFIDGSHHDSQPQQEKDTEITNCLESAGATVIRFAYQDDWDATFARFSYIFGGKA